MIRREFQCLSMEKISRFIDYATVLKRDILLTESALHPATDPPPHASMHLILV